MKHPLHILRTLALGIACILLAHTVQAQYVPIPDASFRTFLQSYASGCMNAGQLDTNCAKAFAGGTMNCAGRGISDITGIEYFHRVKDLRCNNNSITSIGVLPDSIQVFMCYSNGLTGIVHLPANLENLQCQLNRLGGLPALPANLKLINCANNPLYLLPALPNGLITLLCFEDSLTSLPALPPSLTSLYCDHNSLVNLPTLNNGLLDLDCGFNPLLNNLPALPASLERLYCSNNALLTTLPALPAGMVLINASNCGLTALPAPLPAALVDLYCQGNSISGTFPALPQHLSTMDCSNNAITGFALMNDSLNSFYCYTNQILTFPRFPSTLRRLNASNNRLVSLPPLPVILDELDISFNPNLYCLPPLKRFNGTANQVSIQNTGIACLPNNIYHPNAANIPAIDNMPLCSFFNDYGCEIGGNIHGKVFNDTNADCRQADSEVNIGQVKLNLLESNSKVVQQVYTSNLGQFSFTATQGAYNLKVDTTDLPLKVLCPANNNYLNTIQPADSLVFGNDFALECKGFDIGAKSVVGRFSVGRVAPLYIRAGDLSGAFGLICAAGISGKVMAIIEGPATYISPAPGALAPASVSGDTITWNVNSFAASKINEDYNIIVQTDTNAVPGTTLCIKIVVTTPSPNDIQPANNILVVCFKILASCDPNEKAVSPVSVIDTTHRWATYTIFFQNTGSDTAEHVYIRDTLDHNFDPTTFQLLSASHKNITQVLDYKIVQFNFPNIKLVDSLTNEPLSHGYVQYRIKLKDSIPDGAVLRNTAYIYFDFNAPVITNTTENTLGRQEIITGAAAAMQPGKDIQLYPNPATDRLFITAINFKPQWISLWNMNGQKILEQPFATPVDISTVAAGIYIVEVKGSEATARKKLVKTSR